eukprot:Em0023g126a
MPRSPTSSKVVAGLPAAEPNTADRELSDGEEENQSLETSHNGRWQKTKQQVARDVPGIDAAYLAMDTENGVEVVWNEVCYSNRRASRGGHRKERLAKILQKLTEVKHYNIINFVDFWHDKVNQLDRLVFITEYITSGSLLQFLKMTKNPLIPGYGEDGVDKFISAKSRVLSGDGEDYLHENDIVHGNLSLASIFLQHDGLIKIGSVSPDAIQEHVKSRLEDSELVYLHYSAPEYVTLSTVQTPVDIYAFGICALEMLNLDLLGNVDILPQSERKEAIERSIESLAGPVKQFIKLCTSEAPEQRPRAADILNHPVLQDVYNLKLLSAMAIGSKVEVETQLERWDRQHRSEPDRVVAELHSEDQQLINEWRIMPTQARVDLDKLFEEAIHDVLYDPVSQTHMIPKKQPRAALLNGAGESSVQVEARKIVHVECDLSYDKEADTRELLVTVKFDDHVVREMRSQLNKGDDPEDLASDLLMNGLIREDDKQKVASAILEKLEGTGSSS